MEIEKNEVNTPVALLGNDKDDEVIIPAVDENNIVVDEKKGKLSESSVSSTDEEEGSLEQKKPKPVEGETAKETALRRQIEKKNTIIHELQEKAKGNLFDDKVANKGVDIKKIATLKEVLGDRYADSEIENMTQVIAEVAPRLGFVKAEQIEKMTLNQLFNDFKELHPEYESKNDEDGSRYETFKTILFSDYSSLEGRDIKDIKKILNKVHRDVNDILGESEIVSNNRDMGEILADRQKINSISHSGGTQSPTAKPNKPKIDTTKPIGGVMFKGFDEDDF